MVPTAKKWFLPPKNDSYHLPNDSYHRKMVPTNRRTIPTIAERSLPSAEPFLPSPNRSYRPPNRSYHRRTVCTIVKNTDWQDRRIVWLGGSNRFWSDKACFVPIENKASFVAPNIIRNDLRRSTALAISARGDAHDFAENAGKIVRVFVAHLRADFAHTQGGGVQEKTGALNFDVNKIVQG